MWRIALNTVTRKLYVCDTNAILSYFGHVLGAKNCLTDRGLRVMRDALCMTDNGVRLSVPSVVFIEIFDKWCMDDISVRKVYRQVFRYMAESPYVEIKSIDEEVLEAVLLIGGDLQDHEMHDKIILASAMALQCPLISSDGALKKYNAAAHAVPEIFS